MPEQQNKQKGKRKELQQRQQGDQLTEQKHAKELSSTIKAAIDTILPDECELTSPLEKKYGDVREVFCTSEQFQTKLLTESQRCARIIVFNSTHSGNADAAAWHVSRYLPLLLVYIGMGYHQAPNDSLTLAQRKQACKLFLGCNSFRDYVLCMLQRGAGVKDKGGACSACVESLTAACSVMTWHGAHTYTA